MNKFFTTLMAFALGVTAVNAQQVKIAKPGGELNINRIVKPAQQLRTWGAAKKVANVAPLALPQTRAGEATQHVLGYYKFYTTPDPSFGMEFQTSGYVELAVAFMPPSFGKCLGGTVSSVRVAFADRVTGPTVYVYKMTRSAEGSYSLDDYTPVATGTRPYTSAGWNEFELDNPITLGAEDGYVVSIRMRVSADAPTIFTDQPIDPELEDVNGLYMIGEAQTPTGGTQKVMVPAMDADGNGVSDGGFGNWMIQCIVDGGQFSDDDIVIDQFSTIEKYVQAGQPSDIKFALYSEGNNIPQSMTIGFYMDDAEQPFYTIENPLTFTDDYSPLTNPYPQAVQGEINWPADLASGQHTVTMKVDQINGNVPTVNTDDDAIESTFSIYSTSFARQRNLIELSSSQYSNYDPYGIQLVNEMVKDRDDVSVVSIHNSLMDVPANSYEDEFVVDGSNMQCYYMSQYIPSMALNRFLIEDASVNDEGYLAFPIAYDPKYHAQLAPLFESILDSTAMMIPSFANVFINSTVDEAAGKINITVNGSVVSDFNDVFGEDARLNVYLVEDNIRGTQLSAGTRLPMYTHNNILRAYATERQYGDALNIDGDNNYTNSYEVDINSEWKTNNMRVIAFVSRPMAFYGEVNEEGQQELKFNYLNDCVVTQVNECKLGEATGIGSVVADDKEVVEVARYTADGVRISAPVKGLNIIKMSDGTTRKVIY